MRTTLVMLAAAAALGMSVAVARAADEKAGPNDNKPPQGFTALFNGKDLANWQGLIDLKARAAIKPEELAAKQKEANDKILPHWSVKDGILIYDGKGNSLQTAKDYCNFELMVDWKIGPKGDSGIYLRGQPQVQIWEPEASASAKVDGKYVGSGGLFNNKKGPNKPLKVADKPVGEWNTFHIIVKGDKATVKLNGEVVVDDTPLENYWEPGKPVPAKGPIESQHHGNPLYFKNIYIKELPD
jgi:hypothetical protein